VPLTQHAPLRTVTTLPGPQQGSVSTTRQSVHTLLCISPATVRTRLYTRKVRSRVLYTHSRTATQPGTNEADPVPIGRLAALNLVLRGLILRAMCAFQC
jgi:hypothetical protein